MYLKWKTEYIDEMIRLYKQGLSSIAIADSMSTKFNKNFTGSAVRHKILRLPESDSVVRKQHSDGTQEATTILEMHANDSKTPEDVLLAHGYDPDMWELTSSISNFWGQTEDINLYQTKINVKPKTGINTADLLEIYNRKIEPVHVKTTAVGVRHLIVPIFDAHFGWETYDDAQDYLNELQRIMTHGYQSIDIIIGGDYFHSDFMTKSMTVHDTQLDHVDNIQSLSDGTCFFSELIETALTSAEDVTVHAIPGNHDADKQYMWMYAMQYKYPDAKIINSINKREAFQVGSIGVLDAHGDLALKRLPMIFATEYTDIWASSSYRVIFTGHFHELKVTDDNGVVLHQCGTGKPKDNYESDNGFVLSHRAMEAFEFSDTQLKATYHIEKE
ncbi:metallophosphoesterase [Paucilactobacillus sp. N302-9]